MPRKNKLLEFIKEHEPKFEKQTDGSWQIFTVATQHVNKPTLEECIKFCYYVIEEKPILKYPDLTELKKLFKEGKLPIQDAYPCRLGGSINGYRPGFMTRSELELICSSKYEEMNRKALRELEMQIMWGKDYKKDLLKDKSNEIL